MGGSAALAAQATSLIAADALAIVATHVYLPKLDPSPVRRAAYAALIEGLRRTTARVGYFPARMLRQGSDDEAAPFIHDVVRFFRDDAWKSADGAIDYLAALSDIRVPVLSVVSEADRIRCPPACVARTLERIRGPVELRVISEGDDGSSAPSHMDLVTGKRSRGVRDLVVRWVMDRDAVNRQQSR
jgi:pimeloyl-ACP methyl ester carboxylesterase